MYRVSQGQKPWLEEIVNRGDSGGVVFLRMVDGAPFPRTLEEQCLFFQRFAAGSGRHYADGGRARGLRQQQ